MLQVACIAFQNASNDSFCDYLGDLWDIFMVNVFAPVLYLTHLMPSNHKPNTRYKVAALKVRIYFVSCITGCYHRDCQSWQMFGDTRYHMKYETSVGTAKIREELCKWTKLSLRWEICKTLARVTRRNYPNKCSLRGTKWDSNSPIQMIECCQTLNGFNGSDRFKNDWHLCHRFLFLSHFALS